MVFFPLTRTPRLCDGGRLSVGGHAVRLKVNPRARRVSLRLDAARREIVAIAPSERRLKEAAAFAGERLPWIRAQLEALPVAEPLVAGAVIEVLGRPCRLESAARRTETGLFEEAAGLRLAALGDGEIFGVRAIRLLKAHALQVLSERTACHAAALGRRAPPVTLTDAKGRWGSCKPPRPGTDELGAIRYSWRLVLAPYEVADYVAAHECAHLIEANHGPRFWALVRGLTRRTSESRAWLRAHGARLQAVGRPPPAA
jgi:predicted metal-dependent hydrolase